MDMFVSILSQMLILFAFIAIGFVLSKTKVLADGTATVLSKLENFVFVPALVMSTFIKNCTTKNIGALWKIILFSFILLAVLLPITFLFAKIRKLVVSVKLVKKSQTIIKLKLFI